MFSVLDQLGGDERTDLEPWRELTDAFGNRYFVFQQMFDNTTVLGGAVKVITDRNGHMLGLTSSIVTGLLEAQETEGVTAAHAEQIVLEHALETRQQALAIQEGLTNRMILPVALEVDVEAEDDEGSRYVWVVYTNNPDSSLERSSDLPYLAHYETLAGEYLYSLPTIIPGDEASTSGFDAGYDAKLCAHHHTGCDGRASLHRISEAVQGLRQGYRLWRVPVPLRPNCAVGAWLWQCALYW